MNKKCIIMVLAFILAPFQASQAASVSYYLDQSNALVDGPNYLVVTVSDGIGGLIDFKVETLAPLNSIADPSSFGIQKFSFNTTLSNPPESSVQGLPNANWSVNTPPPNNTEDGFGRFDIEVSTTGASDRVSVLNFSINVDGDSIYNYVSELSVSGGPNPPGEGAVLFSAHVAGFNNGNSAYFGGSTPVPVPAAIWLFGSGLLGLAGIARRKKIGQH